MTAEEIKEAALKYEKLPVPDDSYDGFITGAQYVLESEEYRLLVHDARLWRRHQEIVNSRKEI